MIQPEILFEGTIFFLSNNSFITRHKLSHTSVFYSGFYMDLSFNTAEVLEQKCYY